MSQSGRAASLKDPGDWRLSIRNTGRPYRWCWVKRRVFPEGTVYMVRVAWWLIKLMVKA